MAVKYEIQYYDVRNIIHKCWIYDDDYTGSIIEVQGIVYVDYSKAENNLESIRGQGIKVELEANENLTYDDLYSETEKTFLVEYYRDEAIVFKGWLNPAGWYEDFVNSDWYISFDCVDGLGYLKDLSFVESTGLPITGRITQAQILYKALKRTGISKNLETSISIYYTGLATTESVLDNVYVIAERYIKDDGETIMSCEDVIRDIIEPYGAILTSFGDKWYIYKPNELYLNSKLIFDSHDLDGVLLNRYPIEFGVALGSSVNFYYPHHINSNQKISLLPSIGAYRISYKYGLVQSFYDNTGLCSTDGTTISDWDIVDSSYLETLIAGECGIKLQTGLLATQVEQLRTQAITVGNYTPIRVQIKYNSTKLPSIFSSVRIQYKVMVSDKVITDATGKKFYLQSDLSWGADGVDWILNDIDLYKENLVDITTPTLPEDVTDTAYLYVSIYNPNEWPTSYGTTGTLVNITNVKVSPDDSNTGQIIEGEFHTFERTTKPSARVKDVRVVATGDNDTDLYEGTLYKTDAVTPTKTWNRNGFTEEKPILQIMGEETMRMFQKPTKIFSGDIFGYISYLSVITINNINAMFMILEYSYNTKNNIISLTLQQILGDELNDIDYEETPDYGKTVKPTIKG